MLYTIPDYYKEFRCIADRCEDTCCAGWQIVVDEKSMDKYRKVSGEYKRELRKNVNWRKKVFRQREEKRCAFLNDRNLCEMYIHLGEESLCKTCKKYPRHIEEFEGVRELTLSISCPEAARLILEKKDPVKFLYKENEKEEEFDDFDLLLYSQLLDARQVIYSILQNRKLPVEVREGLVYGIVHDMQGRIDRQQLFACEEVLEKYQRETAIAFVADHCRKKDWNQRFHFMRERIEELHELELLKESWENWLFEVEQELFLDETGKTYKNITEEFEVWIKENGFPWEIQKEQLLMYFISTYFCGAVYDGDVLAKGQMAIVSTNILEEMLKVRWIRNEKELELEDVIEISYRFSREIEHSDLNLKNYENSMPEECWNMPCR